VTGENAKDLTARLTVVLESTAEELESAGARREALAEFVPARRAFLIRRQPVMRPLGHVWPLGVFLLATDRAFYATGTTTRAVPPGHPQHVAVSAEVRREYRAAAFRGPFEAGETVNFDAARIDIMDAASLVGSSGPLFVDAAGRLRVRWARDVVDADARDFDGYLAERVDLLLGR
jgi:hypothetical protein